MKNQQKGFIVPLLIAIVALLAVGGGVYVYENNKVEAPIVPIDTSVQTTNEKQSVTNNQPLRPIKTSPASTNTSIDVSKSSISVISPKTGDTLIAGQTYTVTWTSNNVGDQTIFIDLGSTNNTLVKMLGSGKNTGSYSWTIDPSIPQGSYQVAVSTSENLPTGKNTAGGRSGFFNITSRVAMPSAPTISSISPTIAYVNNATFGMGSTVTIKGSGFSEDKIHLMDPSTNTVVTDLSANTPSGNPSSSNEFNISIPNNTKPGSYTIVVEDTAFGLKSQPYPLTVSASN
jgi:hypothetical protein